jgi:acetyltransferase-like isoleucine patch superfamily enzyme
MACFTTRTIAADAAFVRDPPTVIGNDVWIGDHVVIVAGVTIGDGAAIGPSAVVTRDVEPYAIMVGVPARLLRMRFDAEQTSALIQCRFR